MRGQGRRPRSSTRRPRVWIGCRASGRVRKLQVRRYRWERGPASSPTIHQSLPREPWDARTKRRSRIVGKFGSELLAARRQSLVTSATPARAEDSSTIPLLSRKAATRDCSARLLTALGIPRAVWWISAMASSLNGGSLRPARERWCFR